MNKTQTPRREKAISIRTGLKAGGMGRVQIPHNILVADPNIYQTGNGALSSDAMEAIRTTEKMQLENPNLFSIYS